MFCLRNLESTLNTIAWQLPRLATYTTRALTESTTNPNEGKKINEVSKPGSIPDAVPTVKRRLSIYERDALLSPTELAKLNAKRVRIAAARRAKSNYQPRPRPSLETWKAVVVEFHNGLSARAVASKCRIDDSTARRWYRDLRESHGLPRSKQQHRTWTWEKMQSAIAKVDNGSRLATTAHELGIPEDSLRKWWKRSKEPKP